MKVTRTQVNTCAQIHQFKILIELFNMNIYLAIIDHFTDLTFKIPLAISGVPRDRE